MIAHTADAVAFVEGPLKEFLSVGRRPTGPRIRKRAAMPPAYRAGDVVKLTGIPNRFVIERVDGKQIYLEGGTVLTVA